MLDIAYFFPPLLTVDCRASWIVKDPLHPQPLLVRYTIVHLQLDPTPEHGLAESRQPL